MTAEKMAREHVGGTDCIADSDDDIGRTACKDSFIKGYLAGQQSQWREYPKEKPPQGEKVLIFDKTSRSKALGWLEEYQDEDGHWHCNFVDAEGDIVFIGNNNIPSHWMPITLPTQKEGAE